MSSLQNVKQSEDVPLFTNHSCSARSWRKRELPLPLSDARAARVRQHKTAYCSQVARLTVALDGGADLLRPRRDGEHGLGVEPALLGLTSEGRGATHVFVAAVRAAADQTWRRQERVGKNTQKSPEIFEFWLRDLAKIILVKTRKKSQGTLGDAKTESGGGLLYEN